MTPGAGLFFVDRAGGGLREAAFFAAFLLDHFGFFFARTGRCRTPAFVAGAFFLDRVFIAITRPPFTGYRHFASSHP